MRLRNNPKANDILLSSKYVIGNEISFKNKDNEVHIEIGTGKGDFIIGMAQAFPNINFIGIEKYASVLVKAVEKANLLELDNLLFLNCDAIELKDYLDNASVSCLYLNFSDPWPKKRHEKRRLTYNSFLDLYDYFLKKNAIIKMKTDNKSLFEYSLVSFNNHAYKFEELSLDLHNSCYENISMSEYEKKFSSMQMPIYYVKISKKEDGINEI